MKYAIIKVVNGNFSILSEHGNNLEAAIVKFHQECANLWNSKDVVTAQVKIVNEFLETVQGMSENIKHDQNEE